MKILLVGSYVPDHAYSMLRFSELLESELRKAGQAVRVIRPEPRLRAPAVTGRDRSKWLGYADKFILFPRRLRAAAASADVVHICDHSYALYTRHLDFVPHVVTCHDVIGIKAARGEIPGRRTKWTGRVYQRMIEKGLARAHNVACVSETTRSDLGAYVIRAPSATSVVHNTMNYAYRPIDKSESALRLSRLGLATADRFILHVGSTIWNKNQGGVLRMFHRLVEAPQMSDLGLVMVTSGLPPDLNSFIRERGLQPRVRVVSDITSEDLRTLYSTAAALLFPSLYEGFGWPIIEAQACGCPVFTSNRPPMTEVGGDAAVYFDPENPDEAARAILDNLAHASRMREAGLANVKRFSAENMVAGYLRCYQNAIASASSANLQEPAHAA